MRFLLLVLMLSGSRLAAEEGDSTRVILFYGDSLTAGYGIDREQAFPALVQARIDSLGWDFEVFNAGLSGETSAGGLRRATGMLPQPCRLPSRRWHSRAVWCGSICPPIRPQDRSSPLPVRQKGSQAARWSCSIPPVAGWIAGPSGLMAVLP